MRIYLETYGCQMNEYDSELVRSILSGHEFCDGPEDADVILVNTCSVRESACNKIWARLGDLKKLRRERGVRVGVIGCMAEIARDRLLSRGNVDFTVGPDEYRTLPALVEGTTGQPSMTADPAGETYSGVMPSRGTGVNAWLAIMRGCDNFCSFCVVPYVRGRERSRPASEIEDEARAAAAAGFPQVTLLGQNVNSYCDAGCRFPELLERLAEIEALKRIRFTSPHPKDFPAELLHVIRDREKVCRHVHLPLQSGSDEVLGRMNRGYGAERFLEIASSIREKVPGVFLSTDIIVGFPGESSKDFEATSRVMEQARFESSFIFQYSPREGTPAARRFADDVPPEEKSRRCHELNQLQNRLTASALDSLIGTEAEVLVEDERAPLSKLQCQGRISQGAMVVMPQDGSVRTGTFLQVRLTGRTSHVLLGAPV